MTEAWDLSGDTPISSELLRSSGGLPDTPAVTDSTSASTGRTDATATCSETDLFLKWDKELQRTALTTNAKPTKTAKSASAKSTATSASASSNSTPGNTPADVECSSPQTPRAPAS